jgi:hypothetical protein
VMLNIFVVKPSRMNPQMNIDDKIWQIWHFILCQEHDAIRYGAGCYGTPCRNHSIRKPSSRGDA